MSEHKVCRRQLERVQGENVALVAETERLRAAVSHITNICGRMEGKLQQAAARLETVVRVWRKDHAEEYSHDDPSDCARFCDICKILATAAKILATAAKEKP